ncbi:MAG: long-chain fatty acid--CoA ligase [Acidobacteria bacterium]|nr:long-chain fatty acid--CoA ligase [Acidobacteriota bacterium]
MVIRTLCDIPRGLAAGPTRPDQVLYREEGAWRPIATREFCRRILDLALGLRRLGVARGERVALLSENRPEWLATDFAILAAGAVTVPIYPTLLADRIEWILKDSGAVAAVVSTPDQLGKVLAVRARLPALAQVLVMDPGGPLPAGVRHWHEAVEMGAAGPGAALPEAAPDDLASIIYTSGTTGVPKGVMLTHGNFVHNVTACCEVIPFRSDDVCLSFLPLSHVYERMVEYCYLYRGAAIAYAESIDTVARDLQEIRPTIASGVPRVFEKLLRRVLDAGAALPAPRRRVHSWAMDVARRYGASTRPGRATGLALRAQRLLADRLVYSKLRDRLGGRLRFFISGGAALQREIAEFFYGAGVLILEGYGLTETSPVIALNSPGAVRFGTVGLPVHGVEVKVAEDGEILTRSPSVMKGYFNNAEATREANRDGWFCTGDVGRLDEAGYLVITDRKKEILKTSGGKMVAPQPIENLLRSDRYVAQAVVVGDGRRFIAALIVPALDQVERFAREEGVAFSDPRALVRHPRIAALLEQRVALVNDRLARFEQIKSFRLLDRELTIENGEITPTLKYCRKVIEERHRARIEEMYAEPHAAGPRAEGRSARASES